LDKEYLFSCVGIYKFSQQKSSESNEYVRLLELDISSLVLVPENTIRW